MPFPISTPRPLINAADYNQIQKYASAVLGSGGTNPSTNVADQTFGYGQLVESSQVSVGNIVTANHLNLLKKDIDKIAFHQKNATGSGSGVSVGGIISAADWDRYWTEMDTLWINANRFLMSSAQADTVAKDATLGVKQDFSNWNASVIHKARIAFNGANLAEQQANARYFFNAGGTVIFTPENSAASDTVTKNGRWTLLLGSIGANGVRFGANGTSASAGNTIATTIGYYTLTTTDSIIYNIIEAGGALYAGNSFEIKARFTDTNKISIDFTITFSDLAAIAPKTIDENVTSTTTSWVGYSRPQSNPALTSGQVTYVTIPKTTFTLSTQP